MPPWLKAGGRIPSRRTSVCPFAAQKRGREAADGAQPSCPFRASALEEGRFLSPAVGAAGGPGGSLALAFSPQALSGPGGVPLRREHEAGSPARRALTQRRGMILLSSVDSMFKKPFLSRRAAPLRQPHPCIGTGATSICDKKRRGQEQSRPPGNGPTRRGMRQMKSCFVSRDTAPRGEGPPRGRAGKERADDAACRDGRPAACLRREAPGSGSGAVRRRRDKARQGKRVEEAARRRKGDSGQGRLPEAGKGAGRLDVDVFPQGGPRDRGSGASLPGRCRPGPENVPRVCRKGGEIIDL